jgi:hypothetical protein
MKTVFHELKPAPGVADSAPGNFLPIKPVPSIKRQHAVSPV